jgi:predicted dehydrogenase
MTRYVHLPLVRQFPEFQIAALCDPNRRLVEDILPAFPDARGCGSVDELPHLGEFDIAVIVVPPSVLPHVMRSVAPIIRRAIFCEKPLGANLRAATEICESVAGKLLTFCGFNRRFWPAVSELKRLILEHGPLQHLEAAYHKYYLDREGWVREGDLLLWTEMCHALDLILELGGPVSDASFIGNTVGSDPFDIVIGQGRFAEGGVWSLNCNFSSGSISTSMVVHTRGMRASLIGASELRVAVDNTAEKIFLLGQGQTREVEEGYYSEWCSFRESLRTGTSGSPFERALETMKLCDLAQHQLEGN